MKTEIILLGYDVVESKTDELGNYTTVITIGCGLSNIPGVTWNMVLPIITHNNSQTGEEVDSQRETVIQEFIAQLNS